MKMKWYQDVLSLLLEEDELWLSYLPGKKLHDLKSLSSFKPKVRGTVLQVIYLLFLILRRIRIRLGRGNHAKCEYFFFASSLNQFSALKGSIKEITKTNASIKIMVSRPFSSFGEFDAITDVVYFSPLDFLKFSFVFVIRFLYVMRATKKNKRLRTDFLSSLCMSQIYLIYFGKILDELDPSFVIVSNDHSVSNRALLLVARRKKIATVYMQHASVSRFFPALNMDYVFLDGESALEIYRECESNISPKARKTTASAIVLSGQKKEVGSDCLNSKMAVGVAVNIVDDVAEVRNLVCLLAAQDFQVVVRFHPRMLMEKSTIEAVKCFSNLEKVSVSDSRKSSVKEYFQTLSVLVAGNSSIHLEAALASVVPIYYEFGIVENSDYYGYVRNNVSHKAASPQEIYYIVAHVLDGRKGIDAEAVRHYSATYHTSWQGREGELVAKCLRRLSSGLGLVEANHLSSVCQKNVVRLNELVVS